MTGTSTINCPLFIIEPRGGWRIRRSLAPAVLLLIGTAALAAPDPPDPNQALVTQGNELEKKGDYKAAIKVWESGVQPPKTMQEARFQNVLHSLIGAAYGRNKEFEASAKEFYAAGQIYFSGPFSKEMTPADWRARGEAARGAGYGYLSAGNHDQATRSYIEAAFDFKQVGDRTAQCQALRDSIVADLGGSKGYQAQYGLVELEKESAGLKTRIVDEALVLEVGKVLIRGGEGVQQAWPRLKQAVDMARRNGNEPVLADALSHLAITYQIMGRYGEALPLIDESLAINRRLKNSTGEAIALELRGIIDHGLGYLEEAIDDFRQALDIWMKLKGQPQTPTLVNAASAFLEMGEYQRGFQLSALANRLAPNQKILERYMLDYSLATGHSSDAQKYYASIYAWNNTMFPMEDGRRQLQMGHPEEARQQFEYARVIGQALDRIDYALGGLIGEGLAFEALGKFQDAFQKYKEGAREMEIIRRSIPESARLNFFAVNANGLPRLEAYEGLVRMALKTGLGVRGALYYAESTKARLFSEMAAEKIVGEDYHVAPETFKEEATLSRQLAELQERVWRSPHGSFEQDKARSEAKAELAAKFDSQEQFIAKLRKTNLDYAWARYPEPLYVEDFTLLKDEVLIEYEVMEKVTTIFIVKPGVAESVDVKVPRAQLRDMVRRYRAPFENVRSFNDLSSFDPKLGKALFDMLLKYAFEARDNATGQPLVPTSSKILIVPDPILGVLPFESLVVDAPERLEMPNGRFGPVPVGVRYVGDDYDIAYIPSGSALTMARRLRKAPKPDRETLFVLADPIFDLSDSRARGEVGWHAAAQDQAVFQRMGLGGIREGASKPEGRPVEHEAAIPRLAKTGILADRLIKDVFTGERSTVLEGSDASETKLNGSDLSKFQYLVFATHGILDGKLPGIHEPTLVLSQIGPESSLNGMLTMSKVMNLNWDADLVALTACQTGLGRAVGGEGVIGLGRAFQYAGARNVLVSLWEVNEDSTIELMESFFREVRKGQPFRDAIRSARKEIRRQGYDHPYYWSPFVLVVD